MSRNLYLGVEYLNDNEDKTINFVCLKEDIGGIIPLIIRDEADDWLKRNPKPRPGLWFKENISSLETYYFWLNDIDSINDKINDKIYSLLDEDDCPENAEFIEEYKRAIEFFVGLKLLIQYFLDEKELYAINDDQIRFIGYIA